MRRISSGKSLILGMPKAPQGNIQGRLKYLSLGMPRKASPLSSSKLSVCFRFRFVNVICAILERLLHLVFTFISCTMLVRDSHWLIYRMLFALHLYLLSMALQNASCASLISFEVWMPVSPHLENHYFYDALLLHLYLLEGGQVYFRKNYTLMLHLYLFVGVLGSGVPRFACLLSWY